MEHRCNAHIVEGLKIWVDVDVQEADFVKVTSLGVRESRGIPADYTDVSGLCTFRCCGSK